MKLTFFTVIGKKLEEEVSPTSSILDIKKQLGQKYNIPFENLKIIYQSRILKDHEIIKNLKIDPKVSFILHKTDEFIQRDAKLIEDNIPIIPIESDPPNFKELVGILVELGFDIHLCQNALRAANYSIEFAIDLLLKP